jgi:cytochrome c peroxidase
VTRNSKVVPLSVAFALSAAFTGGCGNGSATVEPASLKNFAALPETPTISGNNPKAARVELGRMLYYDARLSKGQTVSCNSCHPLAEYGADGKPTSEGHEGQRGARNSPTVYNAAMQFAQFWDGRVANVEQQVSGPLLNPAEMAMPSERAVVAVIKSMPGYVAAFRKAFPGEKDPVTFAHAVEAIGGFERGLITPSRWDRFLQGDQGALTKEERSGFNHFLAAGCDTCHSGVLLGGNAFQKLGVVKEYSDTSDSGRYQVTRKESDRMFFKVPMLRNVAMTRPYFHNGRVATLADAVDQMAEFQTGRPLAPADRDAIVTWLQCLTGDLDGNYVRRPDLPKSSSTTPQATAAAAPSGATRSGIPGA